MKVIETDDLGRRTSGSQWSGPVGSGEGTRPGLTTTDVRQAPRPAELDWVRQVLKPAKSGIRPTEGVASGGPAWTGAPPLVGAGSHRPRSSARRCARRGSLLPRSQHPQFRLLTEGAFALLEMRCEADT